MEYRYDPILCMNVPFGKAKDASKVVLYSSRTRKYVGKNMQYTDNKNDAKTFNSMVEAYKFVDDNYADGHSIKAVVLDAREMDVKDSVSILDEAIKTAYAKVHDSVDIEHIADYLWTWVSGRDIAGELLHEGLDKYSGPHDPEHKKEAYEFARKYAASELNKVYSKLKSVVEKRLKEGFETNKRLIDSYK